MSDTIFRTHKRKDDPFVRVDKDLVNDERLGWDTRGLLIYLLGKPDNWTVRMSDLMKAGPAKLTAMRRMISEAIEHGYMERIRYQTNGGRFVWITNVYECPKAASPSAGFPPMGHPSMDDPPMDDPSAENLPIYQRMSLLTNDLLTNDLTNKPPPPITKANHTVKPDRGGGGSTTQIKPIAAAEVKTPAAKAQKQNTTTAPQADPRRQAQQALINEIIADRLPSWNGHQAYAAALSTLDAWRLLTWLWVFDALARVKELSAYDPDDIRETERIEQEYGKVYAGIDNPVGFIRARVTRGESTHLIAADAAELEEAIVARTKDLQPAVHD
jgi:hypothetical protein